MTEPPPQGSGEACDNGPRNRYHPEGAEVLRARVETVHCSRVDGGESEPAEHEGVGAPSGPVHGPAQGWAAVLSCECCRHVHGLHSTGGTGADSCRSAVLRPFPGAAPAPGRDLLRDLALGAAGRSPYQAGLSGLDQDCKGGGEFARAKRVVGGDCVGIGYGRPPVSLGCGAAPSPGPAFTLSRLPLSSSCRGRCGRRAGLESCAGQGCFGRSGLKAGQPGYAGSGVLAQSSNVSLVRKSGGGEHGIVEL